MSAAPSRLGFARACARGQPPPAALARTSRPGRKLRKPPDAFLAAAFLAGACGSSGSGAVRHAPCVSVASRHGACRAAPLYVAFRRTGRSVLALSREFHGMRFHRSENRMLFACSIREFASRARSGPPAPQDGAGVMWPRVERRRLAAAPTRTRSRAARSWRRRAPVRDAGGQAGATGGGRQGMPRARTAGTSRRAVGGGGRAARESAMPHCCSACRNAGAAQRGTGAARGAAGSGAAPRHGKEHARLARTHRRAQSM